jgi:uncharacterized protein
MATVDLQRCQSCGTVIYPQAERCTHCLSADLAIESVDAGGRLVSWTVGTVSFDPMFEGRTPWSIGLVRFDAGPLVYVHLPDHLQQTGVRCLVHWVTDPAGRKVLVARAADDHMQASPF